MEGQILFAFVPENTEQGSHPIFLENGHHLTIFGANDEVLWSGFLQFVKKSQWFDRHTLEADIWSYVKQKGVSYADWMAWFWHKPPLKASLVSSDSKAEGEPEGG